jgi:hypothetical protein
MYPVDRAAQNRGETPHRSQHMSQRSVRAHTYRTSPLLVPSALAEHLGGSWVPGTNRQGFGVREAA